LATSNCHAEEKGAWNSACIVTLDVKLKTSLFLATALAALVILGFSEWLSYRQMSGFLREHTAIMEAEMNHAALVANLRQGRETLFIRLAWVHVLHAVATVVALVVVLNWLCNRVVLSPIEDLLRHINYMGRGTWTAAIPVHRKDEIGQLTQAFNELGGKLSMTVQQFAAASKLSALALIGHALARRVLTIRDQLRGAELLLVKAREHRAAVPEETLVRLAVAIKALEEIPAVLDEEFERQFRSHSAPPDSGRRAGSQGAASFGSGRRIA
jgi:methyl-accepting chemotaxis protein